ncbi:MAG: LL-diaminopimelate aminotransferase [Chloroflexi bacterium]|nr:LL-diaminopimelate aminotransferase [Chloroflexota bacterium]
MNQPASPGIRVEVAQRLAQLPPYLFVEIDRKKREAVARGVDIINLGIGDPDRPTPPNVVAALEKAAAVAVNHRYPESEGLLSFREAAAQWYQQRFGVTLDPQREVITLIGAKEGVGHLPLALVNPGEVVLIPDPAYPVYQAGTIFAGGQPYYMPLLRRNGFMPDLAAIPGEVARKAKLMYVNYPNNPTGAVASYEFYEQVVAFARENNIVLAQDNTYSEICYDGYLPLSVLQVPGAKEVAVEFHSLSKTYNMTGWRIGFVVGHPQVVEALRSTKANLDSGAFQAVQEAGIEALLNSQAAVEESRRVYQQRRDVLIEGLRAAGIDVEPPKASFYVWLQVPKGYDSALFVSLLIEKAGVVCTPGNGFGKHGEGYVRMALTAEVDRLQEAAQRIGQVLA